MLVQPQLIRLAESGLHLVGVFEDEIQNAPFPVDPSFFSGTENAIKQILRDGLWWQGAIVTRPAHVGIDAIPVALPAHSNLERSESRVSTKLASYNLID